MLLMCMFTATEYAHYNYICYVYMCLKHDAMPISVKWLINYNTIVNLAC